MTSFIDRYGPVQYNRVKLPDRTGICELCPPKNTYFDHCHEHGWIRGELCSSHNIRMARIDADVDQQKWEDWMMRHWYRCPDCAITAGRSLFVPPPALSPEQEIRATAELLATAFPVKRTPFGDDVQRWERILRLSRI